MERILKHFQYDEEVIEQILSKFPKNKQKDDESENESEGEISADVRCEAGMLAKLLGKLEKQSENQENPKCERDPKEPPVKKQRTSEDCRTVGEASEPSEPFQQLVGCPNLSKEKIPPFCSLKVHQGAGSPYVIGTLPAGTKFRGFNSHSRSFDISLSGSAAPSSGNKSGRAKLTESAARAQVVSWLWDWFNHEGSKSLGKK